jgi:Arginine kinase
MVGKIYEFNTVQKGEVIMENWTSFDENKDDLVLSSRIRIARNIKNIPFPHKLSENDAKKTIELVEKSFYKVKSFMDEFKTVLLWENDDNLNNIYLEKHLISPKLINNKSKSAFILDRNETISIMLNEEDHIRLQCISGGLNLKEAFDNANKLDDLLEEDLEYAFEDNLGYVTACPTNIGTGLRASVMLHLPALTMNDEINGLFKILTQVGMTIRGIYGEGSKAHGSIYQISNQITLGVTEKDILNNLEAVVKQIINQENVTRNKLLSTYKYELEDKILRSLGILRTAVILSINEFMELISNVRMGVEMGIIRDISKSAINKLLIEAQSPILINRNNSKATEKSLDLFRANLVKETLN